MDKIINLRLLSHPMNWFTIIFMLAIAGIFGHLVLSLVGIEPKTDAAKSTSPYSEQDAT